MTRDFLRTLAGSILLLALVSRAGVAEAKVKTESIEYKLGDVVLEGYFAYDDASKAKRPGVLVAHEWMGPNAYTKKRAEELAALGYVAFAVDIYGRGVRPKNHDEAGKQAGAFYADRALMRARMNAGLERLKQHPMVDGAQVAAIGYCFGGSAALELARSGAPVKGTVSFHGALDTPNPADAKNIKGKVLVLHGADDNFVPAEKVAAFEKEMRDAKVDWQLVKYGGAVHSFTVPSAGNDPSKGMAYSEVADKRSWEAMRAFFSEIFK